MGAPDDREHLPHDRAPLALQRRRADPGGDDLSTPEERVAELREQIDANDRAIIEAFNHRLRLVAELWRLKDAHGTSRLDPDRERRLREALRASNRGPLSDPALDELVGTLLALTKRELGDTR